jgi:glycosyltransferase involved in cell wall biosynthesis
MNTILSVENALSWSWGLTLHQIIDRLKDFRFVRIMGQRPIDLIHPCKSCGEKNTTKISAVPVADGLVDYFDLTMLQNVCSLRLVKDKKKVVCRSGGMVVDEENKSGRYDEQLKGVAAVIATNEQLFEIGKNANDNTFLIPNGVDLEIFKPGKPNPNRVFTAGFAGNIWGMGLHYKGYKYWVEATIGLLGEIKTKQLLHAHSQIAHDLMPKEFYQQIDCLVLPSLGEGCSNVVTEALACGVPVLTTKVGFHGEKLKDRFNCLFIERNSKDIADKIMLLKNNLALRIDLANNGRRFAEEFHDINKIAQEYDRVFKMVLNNNKN